MPNSEIADLIAKRLMEGITHPGDPRNDQPPMPILLPPFRSTGASHEVAELAQKMAKLVAEAVVYTIEDETQGNSDIVSRDKRKHAEIAPAAPAEPARAVENFTVHCRCDRERSNPLMYLMIKPGDNQIVIDAKQLIGALSQRSIACPHDLIDGTSASIVRKQ